MREHLTPNACGPLAENLLESVERFRSWGIRVPDSSRLIRSAQVLLQVHEAGVYPVAEQRLIEIGRALQDAHDFRYIGACMPPDRLDPIALDLQEAVGGTRVDYEESRAPYQFQVQYLVGAILGFGDVTPITPIASDKSYPDFYFQNGTLWYGVEVKRPASVKGAPRLLNKAARQLSKLRLHSGVVVMDLSECVSNTVEFVRSGSSANRNLEGELETRAEYLEDIVWSEPQRRRRAGFENVGVLLTVARAMVWNMDDLSHPFLQQRCRFATFNDHSGNNLLRIRNRWLVDTFYRGLQAAGYEVAPN